MEITSDKSASLAAGQEAYNTSNEMMTPQFWDEVFQEPDPWGYGTSSYEKWKFDLTLSLLPNRRIRQAFEIGCAEGYLSERLAPLVGSLLSVDISPIAISRARARCGSLGNIDFEVLNLATDELPAGFDLIFCSEVLFYLPQPRLEAVAPGIVRSLNKGGHLLVAHGNIIADDMSKTGFDWGHDFGALTIGKIFQAQEELSLVREVRSPLFTIQLFRRTGSEKKILPAEVAEIDLPPDLVLPPRLEKTILWDGAAITRAEAAAKEYATRVPILMYHSIADDGPSELAPYRVSCAAFREQLRYLRRNGYHSISLNDWAEHIAQRRPVWGRPVIITFDDGYRDFIENALPELERADFSATVFVVTEKAGGLADWDPVSEPLALMDWDELKTITEKGIAVGSHSAGHKDLASLPLDQVLQEGELSRSTLKERLGLEIDIIAFPWGKSSRRARNVLAEAGYAVGVRSWGGTSDLNDDPLNLSRIEIEASDDIDAFAKKLTMERDQTPEEDEEEKKIGGSAGQFSHTGPALNDRGTLMPLNPQYARNLAARLDWLVGEFVKLQDQLLASADPSATLQKKIISLFTLPVTGKFVRTVAPGQEIVDDIQIHFEESATVTIEVEPKADHSLSPEVYLNTFGLKFSGESRWLMLDIGLDWNHLSAAGHFQVSLYGQADRHVTCDIALRLPKMNGPPLELPFAALKLGSSERNAVMQGDITLPDFIELNTRENPHLLVFFDTEQDLSLVINYFNVYFA